MRNLSRQTGFTLMELIGTMAIIAILAATLAPALTDGIDRAYSAREEVNLQVLMEALEAEILQNKAIPRENTAEWTAVVARYADLAREDVEFNARGYRRRLYVDPLFFSTTETTFPGYIQTAGLDRRPYSPRLMLVSDLTGNAPNPPATAAAFAAIWDQQGSPAVQEGPKVKIVRLNLAGHFHRVLLTNSSIQQPGYQLESGAGTAVPAAAGGTDGTLIRYVLRSTRISVFASPYPTGNMTTTTIVAEDVALHYATDGSNWFWERS